MPGGPRGRGPLLPWDRECAEQGRAIDSSHFDILNGMRVWDAFSFQEIRRTDSVDSDSAPSFTILHGVGKGRHSVIVGSRTQGAHAVAVVVHHRWVPHIASDISRNIEVMFVHMPSLLGHTAGEIHQVIRNFGKLVRGQRRHDIFIGMDANFALTERQATPGVVGQALPHDHTPSLQAQELMTEFIQQGPILRFRAVNTFEKWWHQLTVPPPLTRDTLRRKVFGHEKQAFVDLLSMDSNSAAHIEQTYINNEAAFATDHSILLSSVRLPARPQLSSRSPRKPFTGWTPQDPSQHCTEIALALGGKSTTPISRLSDVIFSAARQPATVATRRNALGPTPTEARIAQATTPGAAQERQIWEHRIAIRKERERARAEHVVFHMRLGGWGIQHLVGRHAEMPFLLKDSGERITCTDQIRAEAQSYCSGLFERPDSRFAEEDVQLEAKLLEDQVGNLHDVGATFSQESVRQARLSLKPRKTCGQDQVVPEMLREAAPADWRWAAVFNARIANDPDAREIIEDLVWDSFDVSLLAKASPPKAFNLLRPIAVLLASAKLWSRCMFHALLACGVDCSPSHMGFRRAHSCAELAATLRLILDRRQEWGLPTRIAQIDVALAYDSVRHAAIHRSMQKRGVPGVLALAYLREARRARMRFRHASWHTDPIRAGVGLRQGCSASPMLFRWVLQDCLDERTMTHVAWADDTWLLDATRAGLEEMLRDVATRAEVETGLIPRWDKCWVAEVMHRGASPAAEQPPLTAFPLLSKTSIVADSTCSRLLGAVVQSRPDTYADEWHVLRRKCWAVFHARTRFWKIKQHSLHKVTMLQMAIFPV